VRVDHFATLILALAVACDPALAIAQTPEQSNLLVTAPFDASAKFRAVHIDTLDPFLQPVFEASRRSWLKVLAAHHTTDGRGFFVQMGQHTLMTLRSFNSFTEYDALRAFRAHVEDRLGPGGKAARQAYDSTDVALRTPHNTEVWQREPEGDYHAAGNTLNEYTAGYMLAVSFHVDSNDYDAAWEQIDSALHKASYPISRISFFSTIGSGKQIDFWLAESRSSFKAAGTAYDAVARITGASGATALFLRAKSASSDLTIYDVEPRAELRSPE